MNLESPLWRRCYLHLRWYFYFWNHSDSLVNISCAVFVSSRCFLFPLILEYWRRHIWNFEFDKKVIFLFQPYSSLILSKWCKGWVGGYQSWSKRQCHLSILLRDERENSTCIIEWHDPNKLTLFNPKFYTRR